MDSNKLDDSVQRISLAIQQSNKSFSQSRKANQRINLDDMNSIYLLTNGNVSAHAHSSGSLIVNIFATEIIGLESIRGISLISHIRCVTNVEIHVISTKDMAELLTQKKLWEAAFDIQLRYMIIQARRESKLNQPSAKNTVIEYLKYIWTLKPSQREITSVYVYIMARTNISRSLIHNVISELERKHLAEVHRGILVKCNL